MYTRSLSFNLKPKNESLSSFKLSEILSSYNYTERAIFNVTLVLEEILSNIIKYSGCTSDIRVSTDLYYDRIYIKVVDNGRKFNPVIAEEPDIAEATLSRPIGGLGIFITKKIVEKIVYRRVRMLNVLTMTVKTERKQIDKLNNNLFGIPESENFFSMNFASHSVCI